MKINYYRVEIIAKAGILGEKGNTFSNESIEVLDENDYRYCLRNSRYTTVEKKGDKQYDTVVDKEHIYSYIHDNVWGTRIVYSLYTFKTKRPSTIKYAIESYIKSEFGFIENIDLSFIE